jgi:hypothetical protein
VSRAAAWTRASPRRSGTRSATGTPGGRSPRAGAGLDRQGIDLQRVLPRIARPLSHGQLRLPAADGRISLVSRADVARCPAPLVMAPASGPHYDLDDVRVDLWQGWAGASYEVHRLTGCSPTCYCAWKANGRIAVLRGLTAVLCEARREDDEGDVAVSPITLFDRHGLSLAAPVAAAYGYGSSATQNPLIRATVSAGQRAKAPSSD